MTGLSASELAGFRKTDIIDGFMVIRNSFASGIEKTELKNRHRKREIPITAALQAQLDLMSTRVVGDHLFRLKNGNPFNEASFRKHVWTPAMKRAGLVYRKPYTTRHTFLGWSLLVGVHPESLVRLMGHANRQMVYEVYGKYRQGLTEDCGKITAYFGQDFKTLQQ